MKYVLLAIVFGVGFNLHVRGQIRYDSFNNLFYTHPHSSGINQRHYRILMQKCIDMTIRLRTASDVPLHIVMEQCEFYLKSLGTATALRLLEDLKANEIYYQNGTYMGKMFLK